MSASTITRPAPSATQVRASWTTDAVRRLVRGRSEDAVWERPTFIALLAATAALYLISLGASGWANSFYSAAVQAGSTDWTAFLYGSSDAANSITVDKPPASLWLMALSVRLFGLSSWSILVPQALMGVATVGVLYATVRRHFSAQAALLAGGVLATTPVAVLMFRFNNPDALLVLLLLLATHFTLKGIDSGHVRFVVFAGIAIGFAFLTKQLQAFLILPVLAAVYMWASPRRWGTRLLHLLAALAAVVVSAGWWVAIVELVPAEFRPYIGGSQNNSFLELTFGYNGLGRLTGDETGSVGGGFGGGIASAFGSGAGIGRLFSGEVGGQISWLLPAALVLLTVSFFVLRRAPRTDGRRALIALFGGWLLITAVAFSFMAGIFHAYYTVALAPAIAGVVAGGVALLWSRRHALWARILGASIVLLTAGWAFTLLGEATDWLPWLKFIVLAAGLLTAALMLASTRAVLGWVALVGALVTGLAGPLAYSIQTAATPHTGSIVTAGPPVAAGSIGGPGGQGFGGQGFGGQGFGGQGAPQVPPGGMAGAFGPGAAPNGAFGPGAVPNGGTGPDGVRGTAGAPPGFGGMGGLLGGGTPSSEVVTLIASNASGFRWAAAAVGSNNAASYQLASEEPVMAVGGFNGSDPSPTLAEFQRYVANGEIHYFIATASLGRQNGGSSASSEISAWVAANFTASTIDGVSLYDLS